MSAITIDEGDDTRFEESPLELEVLLLYEDAATGRRGKLALDHVLSRREVMTHANHHVWRLDVLLDPQCQEAAALDAVHADIMALSIHGNNHLPPEVEAILKHWIGISREKPCALVISLDTDARPSPLLLELRSEAVRNGLTVLIQFDDEEPAEPDAAISDIRRRADIISPELNEILNRSEPHPHWGLNE